MPVAPCRGQVYLVSNEFSKASESLRRSIDLCPELPIAWAALGVALFKLAVADGEVSCYETGYRNERSEVVAKLRTQAGDIAPAVSFRNLPVHHFSSMPD